MKAQITELSTLIADAQAAEFCLDIPLIAESLFPVWPHIDQKPVYEGFDLDIQAELYRLTGVFLNYHGHNEQIKNYQERAKDLLTKAVVLFQDAGDTEKIVEAQICLALCYHYLGDYTNFSALTEMLDGSLPDEHHLSVRLVAQRLGYLFVHNQIDDALALVIKNLPFAEKCRNLRSKGQFYNLAGIVYYMLGDMDASLAFHKDALEYAKQQDNKLYITNNLNQIALCHMQLGDYVTARDYVDKTLAFIPKGRKPYTVDTRAQIYLAEKDFIRALKEAEKACALFEACEDVAGYKDALFTRWRCEIRLNSSKAITTRAVILNEAAKVSEDTVRVYEDRFIAELEAIETEKTKEAQVIRRVKVAGKACAVIPPIVMQKFGVEWETIAVVKPCRQLWASAPVLYLYQDELRLDPVMYDEGFDLWMLDADGQFPSLFDVDVIGIAIW